MADTINSESASNNNKRNSHYLVNKVVIRLDIWRTIIYGVALEEVIRENFPYLGEFTHHLSNYIIFLFVCILMVSEPIIRYLYRDFTIREIHDDTLKSELWLVFSAFAIEIAALLCLCFGVSGLNDLTHWKYLLVYFFLNWLLNFLESRKIYFQRQREEPALTLKTANAKILRGEIEYFFLGKDAKPFIGWSNYSEQYIAYNTLFISLLLFAFLLLHEIFPDWRIYLPVWGYIIVIGLLILLIVGISQGTEGTRKVVLNSILLGLYVLLFLCLLVFVIDRKWVIIFSF